MQRYTVLKQLGDGTYGSVLLATSNETGDKVAIKKMKKKYYSWDECLDLREVKSLRKLTHPNIVKLKEVIRENDQLYFVFEFMKENLYQLMKDRDKLFPDATVRNMIYQVLQGLSFMHKHGFFHRDLKPENLLCQGPELVKIADFGLAREIRSRPPFTDYVSTRWYRAPEVLLRSTNYSSPIDIWAVGCIMAELYTLRPLFPGSSEIDEIFKICSVLGTPKQQEWEEGYKLANAMNFRWPQCVPNNLKSLIPNASQEGIRVVRDMLQWSPVKRPNASQCLKYSIFRVGQNLGPPVGSAKPRPTVTEELPVTHHSSPAKLAPTKPPPVDSWSHLEPEPMLPSIHPSRKQDDFSKNSVNPLWKQDELGKNLNQPVRKPDDQSKNAIQPIKKLDDHFTVSLMKNRKSSRKRWGAGLDSTWDDWDDLDLNKSNKKFAMPHKKEADKENDDELFANIFGNSKNSQTPKSKDLKSGGGRESSAKQIYMNKSRYLPGINPLTSGRQDESLWDPVIGKNLGGGLGRAGKGGNFDTPGGGYIPSFLSNKTSSIAPAYQGWKRAQPSFGAQPAAVKVDSAHKTHRMDWAARYLKS